MGGRGGNSHLASSGFLGKRYGIPSWSAAFKPSADWMNNRAKWAAFVSGYRLSPDMENTIYEHANGYVATGHSFMINARLYDPGNSGKGVEEIFGNDPSSLKTVKALDYAISSHVSKKDAYFVRLESSDAIQADFGFTDREMIDMYDPKLIDSFIGRSSYQPAFTSISAAESKNVFGSRDFKRYIYVPKGTNIFGTRNATESEFILGRDLQTQIMKVAKGPDGKLSIYEMVIGYKKK